MQEAQEQTQPSQPTQASPTKQPKLQKQPKQAKQPKQQKTPFVLELMDPYQTFKDGKPMKIPFVMDGLLTQGGFSILAAKPKVGKSSLARYQSVCVSKGIPILGRDSTQGEVLIISIEDPINHVDNCLKALDYDPKTDARIYLVDKLAPSIDDSIDAIGNALEKMPYVRLVVIDTLAKLLRVDDINDYTKVMPQVEKVRNLARKFPYLHVQGLAHCKKVATDNPFDSMLGSTALRGETDTTIALFEDGPHRAVFVAEVRQGRAIPQTILNAELTEIAGGDVVQNFSLGQPLSEWKSQANAKKQKKEYITGEQKIIAHLQNQDHYSAPREQTLLNIGGNRAKNISAIDRLVQAGVVTVTGIPRSPTDPLILRLDPEAVVTHNFINQHGGIAA